MRQPAALSAGRKKPNNPASGSTTFNPPWKTAPGGTAASGAVSGAIPDLKGKRNQDSKILRVIPENVPTIVSIALIGQEEAFE